MTYRDLINVMMRMPADVLDQRIIVWNEADERFYGCTGHDVANEDEKEVDPGQLYVMVNI